jgi:peptidoglycan lytic transglycosylase D
MAIRSAFLLATVGFWSVLTPGAVLHGAAEPLFSGLGEPSDQTPHETAPPVGPDLLLVTEPGNLETGSAALAIEQTWPAPLIAGAPVASAELAPAFETVVESTVAARPRVGWNPSVPSEFEATGQSPPVTHYPIVTNSQVGFFVDRFTRERREVVRTWLDRSGRFIAMIRDTLKKHGLPEELAFTAMIESGFNPVATSRAGARGLWQFMATTAQRYGLRVDQWVDERLDPEKSTVAAAAYLRDLYELFGSWLLAQAAYNAGEGTIVRAIKVTGSSDFWTLARTELLQQETKEFVPQILAAAHIGRDPDRFGFELTPAKPPAEERVIVPPSTDLRRLSLSVGISVDALRSLNPALVKGVTPPGGTFDLVVPAGTSTEVLAVVQRPRRVVAIFPGPGRPSSAGQAIHVVRPRDTVHGIAKRYGVSVGDVLRWNGLAGQDPIKPGDRLRVTSSGGR